ncbi:RagB/SusD family nutrient uptake outer membrane protein [Aquimarina sp. U1-2]|uniref:RagB/SusD family nutrient uptake outer membrane protein n=1 Tax=Aquimarina sp. U1-2 TaxID=2823141 RepID=UPI001AECAB78|nr:RagB/SusD family nutrient uptake outer membrane protein [Aquimarina sp. U1-2]MBP2831709.1 RagB/SusD family nutrient uptake outer membrane protein [Aquimarina sp. U1-2]
MEKIKFIGICLVAIIVLYGCTDLEEELNDSVSEAADVSAADLLSGAYSSLRELQHEQDILATYVHSSDELIPPTRGADWDDAGAWRDHHLHSWTNTHPHIDKTWRDLNSRAFNAQLVLCNGDASATQIAEATFLRTLSDFLTLDLFGVVPRRACNENLLLPPTQQLNRAEAIDVFISEMEAILENMPNATNRPAIATQNAGRMLLAKLYLNKAVYKATGANGGALAGPYTFDAADMTAAITYLNGISGKSLEDQYFSSFTPTNTETSSEIIFVSENELGGATGPIRNRWHMTMHYNQQPSGWNGFVATADLYNLFEENDVRRSTDIPGLTDVLGYNAGFLIGQQQGPLNGDFELEELDDRPGNPLVFTEEVDIFSSNERNGIRVIKYLPNTVTSVTDENSISFSNDDAPGNDYVFFRYADARLMKAEAIFRGGVDAEGETPLSIINELRNVRNASALTAVSESEILDERSRELYWEGWRRNDQIRFNTYLGTWQEKENASTESALLMPLPAEAIATNPNLTQNPGY